MTKHDEMKILRIELPEDILKAKWCGDFERAQRLIDIRIQNEQIPESQRQRLILEKEILRRLPLDYAYTLEEGLALVQQEIPDFTMEELQDLMDRSCVEWIYIKGVPHLAKRFYSHLLNTDPVISGRAGKSADFEEDDETKFLNENMHKMQEEGGIYYHMKIRANLKIKDSSFEPGKKVRVHIPIPAAAGNMRNIKILNTEPRAIMLADVSHPQRTAYFEEVMTENHPFSVEYEYDCVAMYNVLESAKVTASRNEFDTEEEMPHIRFSPTIRALCEELKGDEENPLKIARKFYDFCTTVVTYSYMREYFTITEIPEYAALNLKGDCGVQALLFITLCRCAGIPARWQSGLYVMPMYTGMHDWAQFYIAPYGWLYADPSFGGSAYRSGNMERWNHYFGNMDPFRMVANSAFYAPMDPEKKFERLDPYDSQVGEIEYEDRGLIRSELEYSWDLLECEEHEIHELN